MNFEKLKEKLIPILAKRNLTIYSIRAKREFGQKIVEILIDTETMDINELEKIHLEYVDTLDDNDLDSNDYLELSSLGAERPIKTKEELIRFKSRYIYLESSVYKGYGTLIDLIDNNILLEINDKGRFRKIEIKFDDAHKMWTAIKF